MSTSRYATGRTATRAWCRSGQGRRESCPPRLPTSRARAGPLAPGGGPRGAAGSATARRASISKRSRAGRDRWRSSCRPLCEETVQTTGKGPKHDRQGCQGGQKRAQPPAAVEPGTVAAVDADGEDADDPCVGRNCQRRQSAEQAKRPEQQNGPGVFQSLDPHRMPDARPTPPRRDRDTAQHTSGTFPCKTCRSRRG